METIKAPVKLSGFAQYLVSQSLVQQELMESIVADVSTSENRVIPLLIKQNVLPASQLASAIAHYFGLPIYDLDTYDPAAVPAELMNNPIVHHHNGIPIFTHDDHLYIAIADPTLPDLNEVSFLTGLKTTFVIVENDKLEKTIQNVGQSALEAVLGDISDSDFNDLDISAGDDTRDDEMEKEELEDAPVVRYINKILLDAINKGASDIHFEPYEKYYRIRFRLDGILVEAAQPPMKLTNYLTARLKVLANLDISERRKPQDGRFKLKISNNRAIDFRLNTCPTLYGEKVVLRILESSGDLLDLDVLGLTAEQKKLFTHNISRSQGMILVTGPTGSGKTVTLYTALSMLNKPETNISTVEDPVEIQLPGINQVQVNIKAGMEFSTALRAFLRQDPDIIMVGEIRDLETAEIAVKAAQTGHLVLSTLHTNSAPETLVRLSNMGIPAYNIASSVCLIIAQRLARRLCENCKKPADIPNELLLEAGYSEQEVNQGLTLFGPNGCECCNDGYKGRLGIYEVMPISNDMARLILSSGNAIDIADQAKKEGIPSLRESGLQKVKDGLTSLDEINRIIKV